MLPRPEPSPALEQLAASTDALRRAIESGDWAAARRAIAQREVEIAALRQALRDRALSGRQAEQLEAAIQSGQEAARLLASRRGEAQSQLALLGAARHRLASWAPKLPEPEPGLDLTG